METALKHPPILLERLMLALIPPAAREAMAGDLWERYRSPPQYVREALGALPFVIVSQARRNANLPVMGLQGFLAFGYFGGFGGSHEAWLPALALLAALSLRAAYQGLSAPSASRAAAETVLVAFSMMVLSRLQRSTNFGWDAGQQFLLFGTLALPLLSIFRVSLAREAGVARKEMTAAEMKQEFYRDAARMAHRNRLESAAFAGAALISALACRQFHFAVPPWSIAGIYGAAAAYLLLAGRPVALPAEFISLRTQYQRALMRQDQLRCFMWWLWLTPLLFAIHARLIDAGVASGDTRQTLWGLGVALLACFVIGAVNRERSGRVQERITGLSRVRERQFC